jgi:hypothetical protein
MHENSDASRRERQLNEALADYYAEAEAGTPPNVQEFLSRHPELADEVASFFAAKEGFERDAAPLLLSQAAAASTTATLDPLAPPKVRYVGDYELLGEIARGGMGVVYRARQISLDRPVALKMVRAGELASPEDVARFRTEAALVAALDHPNIVPIYEVGEHEGHPYFSMKLFEGGNLSRSAGPSRRPAPREAVALLVKVARAIHHAHERGVLHRDLKPANVLLDSRGEPHVADFGLAKRLPAIPDGAAALTGSHAIVGTAGYMSPEQASGRARQLTTAADVYGPGAILYELLIGRPPFDGDNLLETLRRVRDEEPARPRSLDPRLDTELDTVCLKCLAKEPAQRYASAEALADDLERWLRGEPVLARPVSTTRRLGRWCRRNPVVAGLATAVLALLTAVAIGASVAAVSLNDLANKANQAAGAAEDRRRDAVDEKTKAEQERDAKEKALEREAGLRLTAHAQAAVNSDPGLALLLAIEGARRVPGLLANNTLLAALDACHKERTLHASEGGLVAGEMVAAQFSADGRRVLAVCTTGTVTVWNAATGKREARLSARWQTTLEGHFGMAAFSPDGRSFAVTYHGCYHAEHTTDPPQSRTTDLYYTDRVVRVGDTATDKMTALLNGHTGCIVMAAYSPDGRRLLTACADGTARVWDAATGAQQLTLTGGRTALQSAVFSPDGRRILTVTTGQRERWDYPEAKTDGPGHTTIIDPPDIEDPEDPEVIARRGKPYNRGWNGGPGTGLDTREDVYARVFDAATGAVLGTLKQSDLARALAHRSFPTCAAFSPDGERVLTCSMGFTQGQIWEAATGKVLASLKDGEFRATLAAAFSPDGDRVATVAADEERNASGVHVWEAATGK